MFFAFDQSRVLPFAFAINAIDGIDGAVNGAAGFKAGEQDFLRVQWFFGLVRTMVKSVFQDSRLIAFGQSICNTLYKSLYALYKNPFLGAGD